MPKPSRRGALALVACTAVAAIASPVAADANTSNPPNFSISDATGTNKVSVNSSGLLSVLASGKVDTSGSSVSISNLPGTQKVAGSVDVNNFPSTQTVSGSVNVSNFPSTVGVTGRVNTGDAMPSLPYTGTCAAVYNGGGSYSPCSFSLPSGSSSIFVIQSGEVTCANSSIGYITLSYLPAGSAASGPRSTINLAAQAAATQPGAPIAGTNDTNASGGPAGAMLPGPIYVSSAGTVSVNCEMVAPSGTISDQPAAYGFLSGYAY